MDRNELIEAARSGDSHALLALLEVCQPDLQRYARRSCASSDVDDAVQDALWIVYQRVGALKFATAFSGWLFQVVRHICLRLAARASHLQPLQDSFAVRTESAGTIHLRLDVARALAHMDAPYREALVLRDVYGYSTQEAADLLGTSEVALKSRLHRARAAMRQRLQTQER